MVEETLKSRYPTFFYHTITDPSLLSLMEIMRVQYINLAEGILNHCPENRSKSLALTHLEESLMRTIQSLALQGEIIDPREGLSE